MLQEITTRYTFLDRNKKPLDTGRTTAPDQNGHSHRDDFSALTSIIIISAERGNDTKKCVEAIFKNTHEAFEIIISDVGSSDETLKTIMELEDIHRNLHVIYNKQSTGTTGQRNQGIYYSRGDNIVLMDNDVLVLPQWLKHLKAAAAKDKKIGLVGAKLLKTEKDDVYYCGCHTITLEKNGKVYGIGLNKEGPMGNLHRYDPLVMKGGEVPWYTTTTLFAKREALFSVGGFDDMVEGKGIFIANEDKDLSLSIKKAGYTIHYCPESEAIHNHDYTKVDRSDAYHSKYRLHMEQIEKDTRYFLNKWDITYLIEKLPHEDNSKKWDGTRLEPIDLALNSSDRVTMDSLSA